MTTPSQLGTLRRKIDGLEAELLETKKALAAARAQEPADIAFLRQQLGDLNKEKIVRLQQENILLQGQASGEQGLPRYLCHHLAELAKLHAHLFHVMILSRPQTTRRVLSILSLVSNVMFLWDCSV